MNNFLNNFNTREKNLIFIASSLMVIAALFFLINNTVTNLNFSSKQLDKAKSDYEYVVSKAELLGNNAISQSSSIEEIDLFLGNFLPESISDLVIVEEESSLIVSFKTNNLNESILISDEIAFRLGRELNKISYSNNENSITKLFFNNFLRNIYKLRKPKCLQIFVQYKNKVRFLDLYQQSYLKTFFQSFLQDLQKKLRM